MRASLLLPGDDVHRWSTAYSVSAAALPIISLSLGVTMDRMAVTKAPFSIVIGLTRLEPRETGLQRCLKEFLGRKARVCLVEIDQRWREKKAFEPILVDEVERGGWVLRSLVS